MPNTLYSIAEVSQMTGLTTRTIRNYLNKGLLSGEKLDGKWFFTTENFFKMLENPYVEPAIKAKNAAPVFDFIKDDKKIGNSVCFVIDRCISDTEALHLSVHVCSLLEKYNGVNFRFEKKDSHVRIILTGSEEQVRKLYFALDSDEKIPL